MSNGKGLLKLELNSLFLKADVFNRKIHQLIVHFVQCIELGTGYYLESYLVEAIPKGELAVTEALLKMGAKLNGIQHCIHELSTKIFEQCHMGARKDMLELLVTYGLDTSITNMRGQNLLHLFIHKFMKEDDQDVVAIAKILIDSGIPVDKVDNSQITPLILAIAKQHIPLVSFLIEKGADVNKKSCFGQLTFQAAALTGNVDLVKMLVHHGIEINGTSKNGDTALHMACKNNHREIIKFLIQEGAEISVRNKVGVTPFSYLDPEIEDHKECVSLMVKQLSWLIFENRTILRKDLNLLSKCCLAQQLFKEYTTELEKMASVKFYYSYSYFSVFKTSRNIRKLAYLTKSEEFVSKFKANLSIFFHYKKDLQNVFEEVIQFRDDIVEIDRRLNSVFDGIFPSTVIRKLSENLNLKDLPLS